MHGAYTQLDPSWQDDDGDNPALQLGLGLAHPSGVPANAGMQDLTPLDWVHWLYLQPPAEAEVLVQACGRSFITTWDADRQHWLTHEMSAVDSHGNKLPDSLPRVVHVEPPCLAIATSSAGSRDNLQPATPFEPRKLLLVGYNLHEDNTSVAARFLGGYLYIKTRPLVLRADDVHTASDRASVLSSYPWLQHLQPGLQVVELLVHGVNQHGLLQLEGWCGRLLAWRWQVAVVPVPEVATELACYFRLLELRPLLSDPAVLDACSWTESQSEGANGSAMPCVPALPPAPGPAGDLRVDDLMTDLGCWLEFKAGMYALGLRLSGLGEGSDDAISDQISGRWEKSAPDQVTEYSSSLADRFLWAPAASGPQLSDALLHACRSPGYQHQMVDTALQLLGYCCSAAWPATAKMLLNDLVAMGVLWRMVREMTTDDNLTLLHRAVCSGSPQMVHMVTNWGEQHGLPWQWSDEQQGSGIAPLQLAGVLPTIASDGVGRPAPSALVAPVSLPKFANRSADVNGRNSLADWILAEFNAACHFWHGNTTREASSEDMTVAGPGHQGVTPQALCEGQEAIGDHQKALHNMLLQTQLPHPVQTGRPRSDLDDTVTAVDSSSSLHPTACGVGGARPAANGADVTSAAVASVSLRCNVSSPQTVPHSSACSWEDTDSKLAARLDADLLQVEAALEKSALLRASLTAFSNQRLEDAYVMSLVQKRQRMRRLLPGCMACVFVTAMTQELLQHGLSQGMLSFFVFAIPWVHMLWHGLKEGKAVQNSRLYNEEAWVSVMLWHMLVRGLQAANVLKLAASVEDLVYSGFDALSEGAVQVFFLIRTPRMILLRIMFALSAVAIYLRGGQSLVRSVIIAGTGNVLCLVASWAVDLANRRHFLQHAEAVLQKQRAALRPFQYSREKTLVSPAPEAAAGPSSSGLRLRAVTTARQ